MRSKAILVVGGIRVHSEIIVLESRFKSLKTICNNHVKIIYYFKIATEKLV